MKRFLRKTADYLTLVSLLLAMALTVSWLGRIGESTYRGPFRILDGDSLEHGEKRFRLEGIDAPEYRQTCKKGGEDWACGRSAASYLRLRLRSSGAVCTGLGVDRYDRILARCRVGDRDVNAEMVEKGWAVSFGDYYGEEARARDAGRGIWAGEFIRPRQWRDLHADAMVESEGHSLSERITAWLRQFWRGS